MAVVSYCMARGWLLWSCRGCGWQLTASAVHLQVGTLCMCWGPCPLYATQLVITALLACIPEGYQLQVVDQCACNSPAAVIA
jgi:hypothetical protein